MELLKPQGFKDLKLQGVHSVAYSPLGHGSGGLFDLPAVKEIAEEVGKSPAQVGCSNPPLLQAVTRSQCWAGGFWGRSGAEMMSHTLVFFPLNGVVSATQNVATADSDPHLLPNFPSGVAAGEQCRW